MAKARDFKFCTVVRHVIIWHLITNCHGVGVVMVTWRL